MNTRGLPGTFAPMYQESAIGNSVNEPDVRDVLDPLVLRRLRRLDRGVAVLAQVGDAVADPVHVLLDGDDHVAQHRRAAAAR